MHNAGKSDSRNETTLNLLLWRPSPKLKLMETWASFIIRAIYFITGLSSVKAFTNKISPLDWIFN